MPVLLTGLIISYQYGLANQKRKDATVSLASIHNMEPKEGKNEQLSINGEFLKAILVAYEDMEKDASIPAEKKRIENYLIKLRQDKDVFYILFLANRTPQEKGAKGGSSSLGRDVEYSVSKDSYQIKRKQFFK